MALLALSSGYLEAFIGLSPEGWSRVS